MADRTDYDLTRHQEHSGKSMEYLDPVTNEKYVPYCIEPSLGVDRMLLAFLCDAWDEETLEGGDVRTVLHLHPALAPYKCAVLPLQKNKLGALATEIYEKLSRHFMVEYDETGSIGKRYRRQDEIGALLRDRRFRHRRGRHRHRARPRHHDPGPRQGGRPARLYRGTAGVLTPHDGGRGKSPASAIFSDRAYEMFAPRGANSDR